jgi:hypothetical protein
MICTSLSLSLIYHFPNPFFKLLGLQKRVPKASSGNGSSSRISPKSNADADSNTGHSYNNRQICKRLSFRNVLTRWSRRVSLLGHNASRFVETCSHVRTFLDSFDPKHGCGMFLRNVRLTVNGLHREMSQRTGISIPLCDICRNQFTPYVTHGNRLQRRENVT